MDKNKYFSDDTRELLATAQDIALDVGDESISTVHFVLADSLLNRHDSLIELIFKTEEDFISYYNALKKSESRILADTPSGILPLTVDARLTIRNALSEKKKYHHDLVQPYHLFLAMSLIDISFLPVMQPIKDPYLILLDYYKTKGHTFDIQKRVPFISWLKLLLNKS